MISVASGGTAERTASRIWFNALRAGSGTAAKYASTVSGALIFGETFIFAARRLEAAGFAAVFAVVFFLRLWRPFVSARWAGLDFMR